MTLKLHLFVKCAILIVFVQYKFYTVNVKTINAKRTGDNQPDLHTAVNLNKVFEHVLIHTCSFFVTQCSVNCKKDPSKLRLSVKRLDTLNYLHIRQHTHFDLQS